MTKEPKNSKPHRDPMENRGLFQKFADFLFGYDFFISYCWADGRHYAVELQQKLEEHGFKCFLDSSDYAKGDNWRLAGRRALKKTSRLILIGTPKAVLSEPVANELRIFSGLKRRVFPIDFGGALSAIGSQDGIFQYLDPDLLRVLESDSSLKSGPSEEVLSQIHHSFNLLRQDKKRSRWLSGIAAIFGLVATVAVFASFSAVKQERIALENEHRARENLASNDLALAKISIDKNQTSAALHQFWEAYRHAPDDSWKKGSAQRLIEGWLPFAGKTVHADVDGNPLQISRDGRWVLVSSSFDDRTEKVVSTATGQVVLRLPISSERSLRSFSPDGTLLAIFDPSPAEGDLKQEVTLFDFSSLTYRAPFVAPYRFSTFALRNGSELLILPDDGESLDLFDLGTGQVIRKLQSTGTGPLFSGAYLSLSADSNFSLFSTNRTHGYRNIRTGESVPIDFGDIETKNGVLSAGGTYISSTGDEVGTTIVDTATGVTRHDSFDFQSATFHPVNPSRYAFPRSSDIIISDLDLSEEEPNSRNRLSQEGKVVQIAFSEKGDALVASDETNTYTTWKLPMEIEPPSDSGFVFTDDCWHYLYKDLAGNVYVASAEDNQAIGPELSELRSSSIAIESIAVSGDSTTIAINTSSSEGQKIFIYQSETGKLISTITKKNPNSTRSFFSSSTGDTLVSFDSSGGSVTCWDTKSGKELYNSNTREAASDRAARTMLQTTHNNSCNSLLFKRGNILQLLRIRGESTAPLPPITLDISPNDRETNPILSNDGRYFAAVSNSQGNQISVWNSIGVLVSAIDVGRGAPISQIRFSMDASQVAVVRTSAVFVYDVATRRKISGPLPLSGGQFAQEIHFSPDGKILTIVGVIVFEGYGYSVVTDWDVQSGIQLGRSNQYLTLTPKVRYSKSGKDLLLIEMGSNGIEKRRSINAPKMVLREEERMRIKLELTTGYAFADNGERTPLSRPAASQRELRLQDLVGPKTELLNFPLPPPDRHIVDAPINPALTDLNKGQDLENFLIKWIRAGNSTPLNTQAQGDFYYIPAIIDGKAISTKALQLDQKAFEEDFPDRKFSLLEYDILSGSPSSREAEISVLQHVYLKDSDGRERELEIRDDILVITENENRKIKSRSRIDTKVIRDSRKQ